MTPTDLTAEIVTFRARAGTADAALAAAAAGLAEFLSRREGFVSRHLSRGADGTWTDYVIWTDPARAHAAGEALMHEPAAATMMDLIDTETIAMTHAPILLRQNAG